MKAENFEEYKREQRHREQYIAKLQSQFPDLDIRHIVEREPMKELSTLEQASAEEEEDLSEEDDEEEQEEQIEDDFIKFLHKAGLADKDGNLEPMLRAELQQNFLE